VRELLASYADPSGQRDRIVLSGRLISLFPSLRAVLIAQL
jgi:hypothetical protein